MSNIDKQAAQAVADLKAGYTLGHADVAILNELARIALASLEAEPVAYITYKGYLLHAADPKLAEYSEPTPLYDAPPAPVSVPAAMEMDDDFDSAFEHGKAVGWNAYRAAMLQGAEPVTTAYKLPFEQWLSQQAGTIDVECGCVMTEVFFHWLRVAYEAGNSPVTPDGWQLVPKEPTVAMNKAGWAAINEHDEINPTYRAMLAAAPQHEVNK